MTLSFAPERIETWPLERLKPYARNAKTHGADQVAKIAGSMARFGWTVPVLVAGDGEVIAGHGRILAAAQLGLTEAPVIVLGGATFLQAKTANEVLKSQERRLKLQKLKGELVDRDRAEALVFRLARETRDAWVNWPARAAALIAAELGLDPATMQKVLEAHVRAHLDELAEVRIDLG